MDSYQNGVNPCQETVLDIRKRVPKSFARRIGVVFDCVSGCS